ncbi:MAG: hypothetical protein WAW41_07860 [Methylobacter sp.]
MTDLIFANVSQLNREADADPTTLRISVDTKATVNLGEYSRGGKSRGLEAVEALDHDMASKEKLIPGGLLEPVTGQSFLFFGESHKTSDFMVDGLEAWWVQRKPAFSDIRTLVINSDNGPECSGHRTQYLQRLVEFADKTGLVIRLVYYPYMDSSRFASISPLLDWGTTAHVYPAFDLSFCALAIMGYSHVCS